MAGSNRVEALALEISSGGIGNNPPLFLVDPPAFFFVKGAAEGKITAGGNALLSSIYAVDYRFAGLADSLSAAHQTVQSDEEIILLIVQIIFL